MCFHFTDIVNVEYFTSVSDWVIKHFDLPIKKVKILFRVIQSSIAIITFYNSEVLKFKIWSLQQSLAETSTDVHFCASFCFAVTGAYIGHYL